ncbi:MAG: hypothetical protein H7A01_07660 [Hahellaceae bacterium]|nr:hypothetical protein [Hahellaceae bacterium]
MNEPIPNNNEFEAAESALRKVGSNVWFSGLSEEWRDFLVSNTLEQFDNYQMTMLEAAQNMISVFQELVNSNPGILDENPWEVVVQGE